MGNIRLYGSTSGYTELAPPAVAPDGVLSLPSGTGTLAKETGAWTSYTPVLSGFSLGSGTATGSYVQIGKTVFFTASFTLGSGFSAASTPATSLPVTAKIGTGGVATVLFNDAGSNTYVGAANTFGTTTLQGFILGSSGAFAAPSSTTPFTWASGDTILFSGTYEAA